MPGCFDRCWSGKGTKYALADHDENRRKHMSPSAIENSIFAGPVDYGNKGPHNAAASRFMHDTLHTDSLSAHASGNEGDRASRSALGVVSGVTSELVQQPRSRGGGSHGDEGVERGGAGSEARSGAPASGGVLGIAADVGAYDDLAPKVGPEPPAPSGGGEAHAPVTAPARKRKQDRGGGGTDRQSNNATKRSFPPVGVSVLVMQERDLQLSQSFETALVQDIAESQDMKESRLRIVRVHRDQLLVTIQLNVLSGDASDDRSPLQIAADMVSQSAQEGSTLLSGLVTRRITKVKIEESPFKDNDGKGKQSDSWQGGVARVGGKEDMVASVSGRGGSSGKRAVEGQGGGSNMSTADMQKILLPRPSRTGASVPVGETLQMVSDTLQKWADSGGHQRFGGSAADSGHSASGGGVAML